MAGAHNARVVMEKYLMGHGTDKYVGFMSISAEIDPGRTIIIFVGI